VWTVEDVLWAMWQPFAAIDMRGGGAWRHYLCVVSRLASYDRGADIFSRHFATVERECLHALHRTLPEVGENELARGLAHCRLLFERELMSRCGENGDDMPEQRRRSERLIAFLAGGLRALQAEAAHATG